MPRASRFDSKLRRRRPRKAKEGAGEAANRDGRRAAHGDLTLFLCQCACPCLLAPRRGVCMYVLACPCVRILVPDRGGAECVCAYYVRAGRWVPGFPSGACWAARSRAGWRPVGGGRCAMIYRARNAAWFPHPARALPVLHGLDRCDDLICASARSGAILCLCPNYRNESDVFPVLLSLMKQARTWDL